MIHLIAAATHNVVFCVQLSFFHQHGCTTNDSQQKYHSRAAQMYRERLHGQALKALKGHGTKVLDCAQQVTPV